MDYPEIISLLLFVISGLTVSYYLIKDSSEVCRRAKARHDLSKYIEERIRYTREPIGKIFESYGDRIAISDLTDSDDLSISSLIESICTSNYEEALGGAELLKKYTEKEMIKVLEKETRLKKAKIVLPPSVALLAAILLL